jgi:thiamine biosynthesis lipoprotein
MAGTPSIFRFGHEAMSTEFEIFAAGREEDDVRPAAAAAFREVDRIERILSRFDPGSDVGRINRLRPGESLRIGIETVECLRAAERIRRETAGAFDIRFRSAIKRDWTVSPSGGGFEFLVPDEGVGPGEALGASIDLDLGGIGKGYALEKAGAVLAEWDVERALIQAGTSTALGLGPGPVPGGPEKGWPVGVGGPDPGPGVPRAVLLAGFALSGSGTEVKGAHVLDPRTGRSAGGHAAAWAAHRSAAVADALSTAFMVMSTAEVEAFCGRHPEVWALVVAADGRATLFNRKLLPEAKNIEASS